LPQIILPTIPKDAAKSVDFVTKINVCPGSSGAIALKNVRLN
jgi:hypothetical protein